MEEPHNQPLLKSLFESKIHVTNFSGTLIESYQLGIPSLIIDLTGYEFYKAYIDSCKVTFKNKYDDDFNAFYYNFLNNSKYFESIIQSEIVNPSTLFKL